MPKKYKAHVDYRGHRLAVLATDDMGGFMITAGKTVLRQVPLSWALGKPHDVTRDHFRFMKDMVDRALDGNDEIGLYAGLKSFEMQRIIARNSKTMPSEINEYSLTQINGASCWIIPRITMDDGIILNCFGDCDGYEGVDPRGDPEPIKIEGPAS